MVERNFRKSPYKIYIYIYFFPLKVTSWLRWHVKHGQRPRLTQGESRRSGGMFVVGTHRVDVGGGGDWIRMRESSESVFWLSSAWTWFSSTQAKWRMVSTARASRLIQPSSFPGWLHFVVRTLRAQGWGKGVEGKEETGHRSVRWFNHRG